MLTETIDRRSSQILVVEDDVDSRCALINVLEDEGYTVAAVSSGREALHYLETAPAPGLILLDLLMPGMDGWEFRHSQKQVVRLARIPVISISAAGKLLDADMALRKPLDIDELLRAVKRYVTSTERSSTGKRTAKHAGESETE